MYLDSFARNQKDIKDNSRILPAEVEINSRATL